MPEHLFTEGGEEGGAGGTSGGNLLAGSRPERPRAVGLLVPADAAPFW